MKIYSKQAGDRIEVHFYPNQNGVVAVNYVDADSCKVYSAEDDCRFKNSGFVISEFFKVAKAHLTKSGDVLEEFLKDALKFKLVIYPSSDRKEGPKCIEYMCWVVTKRRTFWSFDVEKVSVVLKS